MIMAAPFSAIIMVGELVLPEVLVCHAEPSLAATRETLLLARFAEIIPPATTFFSLGSGKPTRGESPRRPDDNRFGFCSTVARLQQTQRVEEE